MFPFIMIGFIVLYAISMIVCIPWLTHLDMTKSHSHNYGWGTFKEFKREFLKYEWENSEWFSNSFWDRSNDCELHASIIKFNGIGMRMRTPLDYYLAISFVKKSMNKRYYDWSISR